MTTIVNIKNTKRYDIYIGRGGPWGNPFDYRKMGITREECLSLYKEWFYKKLNNSKFRDSVLTLKDKVLGCYCKPDLCHGDIIIEYLNETTGSIAKSRPTGIVQDSLWFGNEQVGN